MKGLAGLLPWGSSSDRDQLSDHARREQRLEQIRESVDQFMYDLALLIAGHGVPEGAFEHDLGARLQNQLQPFRAAGGVVRPDFGSFGDLRVEGELLNTINPMLATLEFDDRCVRETPEGAIVPVRSRRLLVRMHVAGDPVRIMDCSVSEACDDQR